MNDCISDRQIITSLQMRSVPPPIPLSPVHLHSTCCLVPDVVIQHGAVHVAVAVARVAIRGSGRGQPGLDVQKELLDGADLSSRHHTVTDDIFVLH